MSGPAVTSAPAPPPRCRGDHLGMGGASAGTDVVTVSAVTALDALGSSRRGLSEQEAGRRLAAAGANLLPRPRRRSAGAELAAQLSNMFAVVLMVAAGLTFFIYFLSSPRDLANLELALGILGVVVLNALIGFAQEHAAERTAEALQAMVPHRARVFRAGHLTEIPAADLVPGDVISLEAGDAVSADARLIEAHALSIEMAALTGESEPVGRTSEPARAGVAPAEARNCVFMGTSVTAGTGKAVVFATGLGTEFGKIYQLTAGVLAERSPLQRQVADMARRVAVVAIAAGGLLFGLRLPPGDCKSSPATPASPEGLRPPARSTPTYSSLPPGSMKKISSSPSWPAATSKFPVSSPRSETMPTAGCLAPTGASTLPSPQPPPSSPLSKRPPAPLAPSASPISPSAYPSSRPTSPPPRRRPAKPRRN